MQHAIPIDALGSRGPAMAAAVSACVHCGFCLPACPTYKVLGEEMDSPRGRIVLMKEVLEGGLPLADAAVHLDRCLGCLACESACPSGVPYHDLIEAMRERLAEARPAWQRRGTAWLLDAMESPRRFRRAAAAGRLARPLAALLPSSLASMLGLLPAHVPAAVAHPAVVPAAGARRGRVALLTGCVQDVLRPSITTATARVLAANGVEVVTPGNQGCCGALAAHDGEHARGMARAEALAATLAATLPPDVDAVIATAAGCGSWLKAQPWTMPVLDATEYLDALGTRTPFALAAPAVAVYQDACHLAHAQRVTAPPRRLLQRVDGLTLAALADPGLCCGSAGLYNITQPELAGELGARKAAAVAASGAAIVLTGNIGCLTQLDAALAAGGHHAVRVQHVMELLAETCAPSASPP